MILEQMTQLYFECFSIARILPTKSKNSLGAVYVSIVLRAVITMVEEHNWRLDIFSLCLCVVHTEHLLWAQMRVPHSSNIAILERVSCRDIKVLYTTKNIFIQYPCASTHKVCCERFVCSMQKWYIRVIRTNEPCAGNKYIDQYTHENTM